MGLLLKFFNSEANARDPQRSPLSLPATNMPPTTLTSPTFGSAPEPQLLTNEPANLDQFRQPLREQLHGYAWVDEKAGVARIPIGEAKRLLAERGLPVRPDPVTDPSLGTRAPAFGESSSGRTITHPPAGAAAGTGRPRAQRPLMRNLLRAACLLALTVASARSYAQTPSGLAEPGDATSARPGLLAKIGIDQQIGRQLPLDLPFIDESGHSVRLGDYFGKRPVILALAYYECPMLCTQVLNGLVSAAQRAELRGRPRVRRRRRQLQPEGRARAGVAEEGELPRALRPAADGGRLALPDGNRGVHRAADRGGRLPLRVRREDRAVRARRGDRGR